MSERDAIHPPALAVPSPQSAVDEARAALGELRSLLSEDAIAALEVFAGPTPMVHTSYALIVERGGLAKIADLAGREPIVLPPISREDGERWERARVGAMETVATRERASPTGEP